MSHRNKCSHQAIEKKDFAKVHKVFKKYLGQPKESNNLEVSLKNAVRRGDLELAEYLLKLGARLTGPSWVKKSLARSCTKVRREMLAILLQYGLDTNIKDRKGRNLLEMLVHFAKSNDDDVIRVAELLVNYGVPVDSSLHSCIREQKMNLIPYLCVVADVNQEDDSGDFPIHLATRTGNTDIVHYLVCHGADVDARDRDGRTALHHACDLGLREIVGLLLRKGTDTIVLDRINQTPLLLLRQSKVYERCLIMLAKEYAKADLIPERDMEVIRANIAARDCFDRCVDELRRMTGTKFYGPYSLIDILKMRSVEKLARLTKNEGFSFGLLSSLRDFPCYRNDLIRIFEEAVRLRDRLDAVEARLKCVFGDSLPEAVIWKLTEDLRLEDLPLS